MEKEGNIKMTHKEYRDFKRELLGVKKFEVDGVSCEYMFECTTKFKNVNFCRTLKFKKCIQYQVYKLLSLNRRLKDSQGHLDNDKFTKNGKCIINADKVCLTIKKKGCGG